MKPTLDSITAGYRAAQDMNLATLAALLQLSNASTAHRCTSPTLARDKLRAARANLITLRRTQTAALGHIDDALKSLET
ncbi:MAG: hypothetical protein QM813_09410 [Verrucomicrobiota bacterium]